MFSCETSAVLANLVERHAQIAVRNECGAEDILYSKAGAGGLHCKNVETVVYVFSIAPEAGDKRTPSPFECGTNDLTDLRQAVIAAAVAAEEGRAHYVPDLTYGPHTWLGGRWDDRLPAIDQDIADMAGILAGRDGTAVDGETTNAGLAAALVDRVQGWTSPQQLTCAHSQPTDIATGEDIALTCSPLDAVRRAGRLYFRHVNQAAPWQSSPLDFRDGAYHGAIPGDYTAAPYPLQYYFEFQGEGEVTLFPGLSESVAGQPYFTVRINKNTALQAG